MYDLIDKKTQKYYILAHKYLLLIFSMLSVMLGILTIFIFILLYFFIISISLSFIFLITTEKNKRKYANRFFYNDEKIIIYNYKNKKIKEIKIELVKCQYIKVAFDEFPKFNYKNCLIIYYDFEPYENMEYSSYWNANNIIIIQNQQSIDMIKKVIC
ncbi:MAG: hypothetical protein SOU07_06235 [Bacilli bacterium]|nr:hypothetical protein [Acholeplasmataceae bacterium]MDY2903020.1 hypothetical protein [Bacilli bacterium]